MSNVDLSLVRSQFPALALRDAGRPAVYFDGPGGTQVPQSVVDAMGRYLIQANANHGGAFRTSRESDTILAAAHDAMADMLNAPSAQEIIFGANMTTLTFALSRAIGRELVAGDEIIITRLDHDADRAPWLALVERGAIVHEIDFDPADCTLRLDELAAKLNERTKVVAVGYASNAVGTVNPIAQIAQMAHSVGAWLWVDAVHYAPHGPINVQALECDFLVCSPYKFFGPHAGVVWGRYDLLERLRAYKVRPAGNLPPDKFETGTQSHEAQVTYLAELGEEFGARYADRFPGFTGRRLALKQALAAIQAYERPLFERLVAGLLEIPGLSFYGIRDFNRFDRRTPTAAFRLKGRSPREVEEQLSQRGVYVWSGNFHAIAVTERLGLEERQGLETSGGVVRAGLAHYNTQEEVDYCLACLREIAAS